MKYLMLDVCSIQTILVISTPAWSYWCKLNMTRKMHLCVFRYDYCFVVAFPWSKRDEWSECLYAQTIDVEEDQGFVTMKNLNQHRLNTKYNKMNDNNISTRI